jgi:hypothetical protein
LSRKEIDKSLNKLWELYWGEKMSCKQAEDGWCPKENDKEWGRCADCEVVGELEKLEEKNTELMKEVSELKGHLNTLHQRRMRE